ARDRGTDAAAGKKMADCEGVSLPRRDAARRTRRLSARPATVRRSPAEQRRPPPESSTPPTSRWPRDSRPCTTRTKQSSRPKRRGSDASVHRSADRERRSRGRAATPRPSLRDLALQHRFAELPRCIPIARGTLEDEKANAVPGIVSD